MQKVAPSPCERFTSCNAGICSGVCEFQIRRGIRIDLALDIGELNITTEMVRELIYNTPRTPHGCLKVSISVNQKLLLEKANLGLYVKAAACGRNVVPK